MDWTYHNAESRQALPGRSWTGTHREKGGEEDHICHGKELYKLNCISMIWEEEKRAAKDRESWKLVVSAQCSRGNNEK